MKQLGPQYATANFYFPNDHGADVIMELITKENPMTPERMRKIQAFRISGFYTLLKIYRPFSIRKGAVNFLKVSKPCF